MFGLEGEPGHAQRACIAALALRENMASYAHAVSAHHAIELAVRIGVNTGEMAVGHARGRDTRGLVAGHAAGVAKRIESVTEPGSVYISETTALALDDSFFLRELR